MSRSFFLGVFSCEEKSQVCNLEEALAALCVCFFSAGSCAPESLGKIRQALPVHSPLERFEEVPQVSVAQSEGFQETFELSLNGLQRVLLVV